MRDSLSILVIASSLSISSNSYAIDLSIENEITKIARARCASELKVGEDFRTTKLANGDVELSFLGKKGVGLEGTFVYKAKEWKEQQKVLAEHQADRDSEHTKCIKDEVASLRRTYVEPPAKEIKKN